MKIALNLATRPYVDQGPALKRLRIGMAVLVVVLAGLGFGLMHFHQAALRMAAQEDQVNRQIAAIRREQTGYQAQMQQPVNAKVLKQAEFLNGLFDEKSFSWTAAMEDLERVLPAGVQVTAIEPVRAKDGGRLTLRLKVSGQRERAVEMVRNMEHSRRFASPRISGENAENSSQGDLRPVQDMGKVSFDVLAEYNPATLEERKAEIAAQKRAHPQTEAQSEKRAPVAAASGGKRMGYTPPNAQPVRAVPVPGMQPGAPPMSHPNVIMNRNRPPATIPPPTQGGPQ